MNRSSQFDVLGEAFRDALSQLHAYSAPVLTDGDKLAIAYGELDRAHQEIGRLLRVHTQIADALKDSKGLHGGAELTSEMQGAQVIDQAVKKKRLDAAHIWAEALYPRHKKNAGLLRSYRNLETKRGAISEVIRLTHELANVDRHASADGIRQLEGRFKEIAGWIPFIPGGTKEIEPFEDKRILHLVKESRPHLSNGFTSRSHKNFLAEVGVGLDPIVVTEPGFACGEKASAGRYVENVDGVPHVRLSAGRIDYGALPVDQFLQAFALLAYEEVKRYRPAVIHASSGRRGFDTALVALALKMKTGLPFVYEVRSFFEANWTDDLEWESKSEIFERRMLVETLCMHAADRVLTIGEAMRDELVARGVSRDKIEVIPNAVDVEVFPEQERSRALSERLGLQDHPTFGYVSNMDHFRESQETLIEAARILKDAGSDARCLLVGGGPRMSALKNLAKNLGVADRVVFTGPVDHFDIAEYYALIDVFVVPRIGERAATYVTPLKPFEAMAVGRPLVVSDLPALIEIADPPSRGYSFPAGEASALADVLLGIFENPEEAALRRARAREWVVSERTWTGNGRRYLDVFSQLLEGRA